MTDPLRRLKFLPWRSLLQVSALTTLIVVVLDLILTVGYAQFFVIRSTLNILGAVSTGTVWQFGVLHRDTRLFEQDLNLYSIPRDLEQVQRMLRKVLHWRSIS